MNIKDNKLQRFNPNQPLLPGSGGAGN